MSNPNELHRLVYLSRATRPMQRGELEDLLLGARKRNEDRGVTGLLLYDAGTFLQILEGPHDVVDTLFWAIERDPRHHATAILSRGPIERRDFENWAMGYENLNRRVDADVGRIREIMQTRRVSDPGAAYAYLLAFRDSMKAAAPVT